MEKGQNSKNNKYRLPLGSAAGGLSYTFTVVVSLLINLIVSAIISLGSFQDTDAAKYLAVLVSPAAIAVTLTLALVLVKQPVKGIIPVKSHPKYFLIGALLIFGLLFSLSTVNDWLVKLFELMGYKRKPSFLPDYSGFKVVPVLLTYAVIPAVFEEILFRGILLNNAEEGAGSIRAILLSGFCFSLYHGSVEQTIYQFICGCLFALLAVRSKAITPTVVIHFINNALIIILYAAGAMDPATDGLIISKGGEIALTVLSAVSLVGATVWLVLDKKLLKPCKEGGVKQFFVFAAIGIGAMALVWIAGLF
ncbi:MAG: CPBP family intramembrane metalloprotease [Roseburia sp.]|nr:CPBP family intramembrane metalloprotease [Roseburia sp.]